MPTTFESTHDVTRLLGAYRRDETGAFEELITVLYPELRRLARRQRQRCRQLHTRETTGLVHEAYLKLGPGRRAWRDRGHLLASVGQAMRHILVDAARRRLCARHGAGQLPETLEEDAAEAPDRSVEILAVDRALTKLRHLDERLCRVIECRFFGGMTERETADALGISPRTVHRDWLRGKGWLRRELGREDRRLDLASPLGGAH